MDAKPRSIPSSLDQDMTVYDWGECYQVQYFMASDLSHCTHEMQFIWLNKGKARYISLRRSMFAHLFNARSFCTNLLSSVIGKISNDLHTLASMLFCKHYHAHTRCHMQCHDRLIFIMKIPYPERRSSYWNKTQISLCTLVHVYSDPHRHLNFNCHIQI